MGAGAGAGAGMGATGVEASVLVMMPLTYAAIIVVAFGRAGVVTHCASGRMTIKHRILSRRCGREGREALRDAVAVAPLREKRRLDLVHIPHAERLAPRAALHVLDLDRALCDGDVAADRVRSRHDRLVPGDGAPARGVRAVDLGAVAELVREVRAGNEDALPDDKGVRDLAAQLRDRKVRGGVDPRDSLLDCAAAAGM